MENKINILLAFTAVCSVAVLLVSMYDVIDSNKIATSNDKYESFKVAESEISTEIAIEKETITETVVETTQVAEVAETESTQESSTESDMSSIDRNINWDENAPALYGFYNAPADYRGNFIVGECDVDLSQYDEGTRESIFQTVEYETIQQGHEFNSYRVTGVEVTGDIVTINFTTPSGEYTTSRTWPMFYPIIKE